MSTTDFPIAEIGLAKKIGVGRSVLRHVRKTRLEKGRHWEQLGRQVMYSEKGALLAAECIEGTLGCIESPELEKRATDELVNEKPPEVVNMVCIRGRWPNPRQIQAVHPDGTLVMVTVANSRNYRPQNFSPNFKNATPLRAQLNSDGIWVKVGRDPRFPGRY